jgi:hypothetical protein
MDGVRVLAPTLLTSHSVRDCSIYLAYISFFTQRWLHSTANDSPLQPLTKTTGLSMPPPLQIAPSRARRQFAARLAQRKALLEQSKELGANENDDKEDGQVSEETQKKEVKEGHERFAKMFEGIEDSSSEDEGDIADFEGEEGDKKIDVKARDALHVD